MPSRKQFTVLFILLVADAVSVFLIYALFADQLVTTAGVPMPNTGVSTFVLGLVNAGIVLALYGILGLLGYWFARKLGLPGVFRQDGNWRHWFFIPLLLGVICGVGFIIGDILFAPINGFGRFVHPHFPVSILASISAGIGEEIVFRGFVFGLWGLFLSWLFKRFNGRMVALWIANLLAAVAFAAGHLGTILVLTGTSSPTGLNQVLLVEVFLLNGIMGLIAGERYMKDGLVASIGVHFWTDIVFHVIWGAI